MNYRGDKLGISRRKWRKIEWKLLNIKTQKNY